MTFRLIQHTSSTAANLLKSPISSPYSTSAIRRTLALNNQLTSSFSQTMSAKSITTAAALIIGDEVLNGKIKDTNSNYFAKFCFDNNIELKNITVIADDEADIVETLQRLSKKYDFIITTGGIGPTHDDITYEAIAKSFGVGIAVDEDLKIKMHRLGRRKIDPVTEKDAYEAQLRMATIPVADQAKGVEVETIYVDPKLWVPIVAINQQVHIFPGIPQLFQRMLDGLFPHIQQRLQAGSFVRYYVTTHHTESQMAHYLTLKQKAADVYGIKVGSYPHIKLGINTVSIIGKAKDDAYLRELVKDIIANVDGTEVSKEEEAKFSHE